MRGLKITAIVLGVLIAIPVIAVVLFKLAYPTYSHRYRLVVAIEANGKIYSGSSVIEVNWVMQPEIDTTGAPGYVDGQAVLINLPGKAAIVVPLNSPSEYRGSKGPLSALYLATTAFNLDSLEGAKRIAKETGRRPLSPDNLPGLIWFSDLSDSSTDRPITHAHLPELLGENARIADSYVELTHDPVVIDIPRKVAWLSELIAQQKGKMLTTQSGEFTLRYRAFVGDYY